MNNTLYSVHLAGILLHIYYFNRLQAATLGFGEIT